MPSLEEYTPIDWQDAPSTETPLSAENLAHMDNAIASLHGDVATIEERLDNITVGDASLMTATFEDDPLPDIDLQSSGSTLANLITGIHSRVAHILDFIASAATKEELATTVSNIAVVEETNIASRAYSPGDYLVYQNGFYKTNTAVAEGTDFTDSVDLVTLGDEIQSAASSGSGNQSSYVGMIIHSTTLSTEAAVINQYGGTAWLLHKGYFLYGADSGVSAGSNVSNGGAATVQLTAGQCAIPSHAHGFTRPTVSSSGAHGHKVYMVKNNVAYASSGTKNFLAHSSNSNASAVDASNASYIDHNSSAHTHTLTGGSVNAYSKATADLAHNNMPPYKNVYIWERTA